MSQRDYLFYVYILANRSRNLYIGLTNNLPKRLAQHREHRPGTYTARYKIDRLVYYEQFGYILNAIARETELKDWNRAKKIDLIEQTNPTWEDLSANW
jgi:putative endonuclease